MRPYKWSSSGHQAKWQQTNQHLSWTPDSMNQYTARILVKYIVQVSRAYYTLLQNRPSFQAICPGSLWARDNMWLLSRVQRLAGSAGGKAFCPGWCLQPGKKALTPLSPSICPRPSHSAHLFHAVLGSGEGGVLAHFFTTFVKIFDSPSIHRR